MSLSAELRAVYDAFAEKAPADLREVMARGGRELAASGPAGRALGVGDKAPAFDLSDELGALHDTFGFDLQRVNGGHSRTLPLPATYVIDRDRTIRWAFVDTDYTVRAEPADILAALDTLGRRARA
ncbi:peroxiredoxin family protein [Streptomyces sp. NPDC059161]|uniref:peroxiredoxin family protein n=1 Tax=Streptomyces sp. NPDC059161 TaxID=3346749 RepID=UPI0036AFACF9